MSETPFTPAVVQRICGHMNKDHNDAVSYYLQHFGKLVAPDECKMVSIDEEGMDIEYLSAGRRAVEHIRFDHHLEDAKDARVTLIDMMYEAVEALGMSRYQVNTYNFDVFQGVMVFFVFILYWIFLTPKTVTPVEPLLRKEFSPLLQKVLMSIPPVAHTLELNLVLIPLLKKHRTTGTVKWYWVIATLLAGGSAIKAYKRLADKERDKAVSKETAGKSH